MKRLVVFASGNGSNAERLITYFRETGQGEVTLILTNNPNAGVIARADRLGVPCEVFSKEDFFRSEKIVQRVRQESPALVVLAGFLWKCPDNLITAYPNQIINIHPSLLPKYGGKGMYGMHVHQAVLAHHEKESGITIHYINENYDEGAIIRQERIAIVPEDTPETLAEKVHHLEYKYFPVVIAELLEKKA